MAVAAETAESNCPARIGSGITRVDPNFAGIRDVGMLRCSLATWRLTVLFLVKVRGQ